MVTVNIYDILAGFWPAKLVFLKSFMPYAKSIVIPEENLDYISASITKCIEIAGKDIGVKIFSNQLTQPIDGLAHISRANGNIYFTGVG